MARTRNASQGGAPRTSKAPSESVSADSPMPRKLLTPAPSTVTVAPATGAPSASVTTPRTLAPLVSRIVPTSVVRPASSLTPWMDEGTRSGAATETPYVPGATPSSRKRPSLSRKLSNATVGSDGRPLSATRTLKTGSALPSSSCAVPETAAPRCRTIPGRTGLGGPADRGVAGGQAYAKPVSPASRPDTMNEPSASLVASGTGSPGVGRDSEPRSSRRRWVRHSRRRPGHGSEARWRDGARSPRRRRAGHQPPRRESWSLRKPAPPLRPYRNRTARLQGENVRRPPPSPAAARGAVGAAAAIQFQCEQGSVQRPPRGSSRRPTTSIPSWSRTSAKASDSGLTTTSRATPGASWARRATTV